MRQQLKNVWPKLKAVLLRSDMPVWLSLIVGIAGGFVAFGGSYIVVPLINQQLKIQEIRTQYIIENVRSINEDTRQILSSITSLSHKLIETNEIDKDKKKIILSRISELQWRIIDLDVIFSETKSDSIISNYKSSLSSLRRSIENLENKDQLALVFNNSEQFAISAYHTLQSLYEMAGIRISESPVSEMRATE